MKRQNWQEKLLYLALAGLAVFITGGAMVLAVAVLSAIDTLYLASVSARLIDGLMKAAAYMAVAGAALTAVGLAGAFTR